MICGKFDRGDDRGQTTVIVALMMVGLLAFVGLVMDGGNAFVERRRMQNAADAAAVAGVKALRAAGATESSVLNAINQYAMANGVESGSDVVAYFVDSDKQPVGSPIGSNGGIPGNAHGVKVEATRSLPTYFAKIVNVNSITAAAEAVALNGKYRGLYDNLFPAAVACDLSPLPFDATTQPPCLPTGPGNTVTIYEKEQITPGNFGWVDFNGRANSNFELTDWIANDYDGEIDLPNWYDGDTGSRGNSFYTELLGRMGTVVNVPIYTAFQGTGNNSEYYFEGVARLELTGFYYGAQANRHYPPTAPACSANPSDKCLRGIWLGWGEQKAYLG